MSAPPDPSNRANRASSADRAGRQDQADRVTDRVGRAGDGSREDRTSGANPAGGSGREDRACGANPAGGASRALFAARCLLDELERGGLRDACLAPGSRSTPLALALAERPSIRTRVLTDERSLSFFALGIAKATDAPVLIACTSGTAAANMLPAVVEASLSGAALLVLTADRPPELRDCAAPQTIEQVGIYGSHTRWSVDVPILDIGERAERYYRSLAMRALASACAEHAGPVHLNLPFREPFWDESFTGGVIEDAAQPEQFAQLARSPRVGVLRGHSRLDSEAIHGLAERLWRAERGLIVCAGRSLPAAEIAALAAMLEWPILADPLCGLRYGTHDRGHVVDAGDVLLRDEDFRRTHRPDAVLRFGSTPAPRSLQTFLEECWPCDHLLVATSGWPDPFHASSAVVRSDPSLLCRDLVEALGGVVVDALGGARGPSQWTAQWLGASRAARDAVDAGVAATGEPGVATFEGAIVGVVARAVADVAGEAGTLFAGNSMPIRDLDVFFGQSARPLRVLANRGASGIDGVLSTALGVACASGEPTALVIGDLSFLHDVTALAAASRLRIPLVTIVINNDGGGIFSYLPQQRLGAMFEPLFGTPHGTDLAAIAAALLPGGYEFAADVHQLDQLVRAALASHQPRVIELRTDRATMPQRSRSVIAAAQTAAFARVSSQAAGNRIAPQATDDRIAPPATRNPGAPQATHDPIASQAADNRIAPLAADDVVAPEPAGRGKR